MGKKARVPSETLAPTPWEAKAAVAALCAAVSGSILSFSVLFDGAFTATKLAWTAAFGSAAAWSVFLAGSSRPTAPRWAPMDAPLAAFCSAAVIAAAFSIDPPLSILGHQGFYTYGLLAGTVLVSLYSASSRAGASGEPLPVLRAVAYSAAGAALLGIFQWSGVPTWHALNFPLPEGRIYSTMGNPVYLGTVMALAAPLCARLAVPADADPLAGKACLALVLAASLLTQSRAAWLGVAAGLVVWAWASGRLARAAAPAGVRTAAAAAGLGLVLGFGLWTRQSGRSDSARVELWKSAVKISAQRPLTGVGPAAFENALLRNKTAGFIRALGPVAGQASAHNDLLQVCATMGLVGLAAYLWCLWGVVVSARAALGPASRKEDAAAVVGALAGLLANTAFEPMPLAAAASAAVLLGVLSPPSGTPERGQAPRILRFGLALLCSAAAWGAWRLARADYWFKAGKTASAAGRPRVAEAALTRAVGLNPYETKFRSELVKALVAAAGKARSVEQRLSLAEEARRASAEGVGLRPGHVDSWKTHGSLLVLLARSGTPQLWPLAAASLDQALARDPWFPPLLEQRRIAAEALGDARKLGELAARRDRLAELARP